MLQTRFCELIKIDLPIVSAGMGGVALAELAASVSEAGGLGTIALAGLPPAAVRDEIAAARRLTNKPLAVNFLLPFLEPDALSAALDAKIEAVTFFWGDQPRSCVERCHRAGARVIWQCGSKREALDAVRAGVDVVIAQGVEAGGHVRGAVGTLALVPEIRDAIGQTPMLAAGGIADGRGLAAALALGADGAVFGTLFLASDEARAHRLYKRRIVESKAEDTIHTTLFDVGWAGAPHRVLRTKVVEEWERAGRPPSGQRPGEGKPIGKMIRGGLEIPLVRYSVFTPADYVEGEVEELPFYAGQSVSLVERIAPAAEIVREIAEQACRVISNRLTPLAR